MVTLLDKRYSGIVVNVSDLSLVTEQNGIFLSAGDSGTIPALEEYLLRTSELGSEEEFKEYIQSVIDNVKLYQQSNLTYVPGFVSDVEKAFCGNANPILVSNSIKDVKSVTEYLTMVTDSLFASYISITNSLPDSLITLVRDETTGDMKKYASILDPIYKSIQTYRGIIEIISKYYKGPEITE